MLDEVPDDAAPQLRENAIAHGCGKTRFEMIVQGCHCKNLPVAQDRVYCLERLREAFDVLSAEHTEKVMSLLPHRDCRLIWEDAVSANSGYDVERQAPFNKSINVL